MANATSKIAGLPSQRQQMETRFVDLMAGKLAQHPADRVYTNDPAGLSFAGCDTFEAIESIFALQFGRQ